MLASPAPPVVAHHQDPLGALLVGSSSSVPICLLLQNASAMMTTFDWSDFPVVGDDSTVLKDGGSYRSTNFSLPQPASDAYFRTERREALKSAMQLPVKPQRKGSYSAADESDTATSSSCSSTPETTTSQNPPSVSSSSSSPSSKKGNKNKKHVSFSNFIEVRRYRLTLGDHPCCAGGMALDMEWDCDENDDGDEGTGKGNVELIDLDVHERFASKRRNSELRLSYAERRRRLCEHMRVSSPELLQLEFELVCGGKSQLRHTPSVRRALMSAYA